MIVLVEDVKCLIQRVRGDILSIRIFVGGRLGLLEGRGQCFKWQAGFLRIWELTSTDTGIRLITKASTHLLDT